MAEAHDSVNRFNRTQHTAKRDSWPARWQNALNVARTEAHITGTCHQWWRRRPQALGCSSRNRAGEAGWGRRAFEDTRADPAGHTLSPRWTRGHKVIKAARKEKQIPFHGTPALAAKFPVTSHAAERKELVKPKSLKFVSKQNQYLFRQIKSEMCHLRP